MFLFKTPEGRWGEWRWRTWKWSKT